MRPLRIYNFFFLLAMTVMLASCSNSDPNDIRACLSGPCGGSSSSGATEILEPTTTAQNIVQCSVNAPSQVSSGQLVTLTIAAAGGVAPYTVPGYGSFSGNISLSGSYTNTATTNRVVQKQFTIYDSEGNTGLCQFTTTVLPSSGSNGSACTLTASTSTPPLNQSFILTLTVPTGVSYYLQQMDLDVNWVENVNQTFTGSNTFALTYTSGGPKTISALVLVNGQQSACTLAINVGGSSTSQSVVLGSSATSVAVGGQIVLTPTLSGFPASPAPTLVLSSSDSTISIAQSGSQYVVTAADSNVHNFTVTAVATSGSLTASGSISLTIGSSAAGH